LNIRSIRSEKGYSPVPPATIKILPELVVPSLSPSPLAQLRIRLSGILPFVSYDVRTPF